MTAYEIIQQHPEWVKNPGATRKEIQAQAARYVRELDNGSKHFNALIVEDLDALLIARNAILSPTNEAKDFAQIAIIGNEIIEDEAKRQAKVYALFIKAIIAELNGKAICTAAQVEQWRERYGVKLEGLQVMRPKNTPAFKPLGFDEETATKIYNWLKDKSIIDCPEDTFIWYFGKEQYRVSETRPKPIEWKGQRNEFVCFCRICTTVTKGKDAHVPWKRVFNVIFGITDNNEEKLNRATLCKIQNDVDSWPYLYSEMQYLFR